MLSRPPRAPGTSRLPWSSHPPLLSSGPFSGIFSAYARVERRLRQLKNPLLSGSTGSAAAFGGEQGVGPAIVINLRSSAMRLTAGGASAEHRGARAGEG